MSLEHVIQLHDALTIELFECVNLVLEQSSVNRLLDHLHIDHFHCHVLLCILVSALIHSTTEASPNLFVESVGIVIDGLTSFAGTLLVLDSWIMSAGYTILLRPVGRQVLPVVEHEFEY